METRRRFDPELVDLTALVHAIRRSFDAPVAGAIVGRAQLRDVVTRELGCSQLQAEQLVDTMISRRFLIADDASGLTVWRIAEQS